MKKVFMMMACAAAACGVFANDSAKFVQRSIKAMEESTAANPAVIRVMFYGQSITAQAWTRQVQKELQEKYPTVKFEFVNKAIGGYGSTVLKRTAEHDLYPWYPDMLFFHVYGPMDDYEEIIRTTREKTTAEIVIWSSHMNSDPEKASAEHDPRAKRIAEIAQTYNCMFVPLREKWRRHLIDNKLSHTNFLSDGVHLNPKGCALYAGFILEDIRRIPNADNASGGTIVTAPISKVQKRADGSMEFRFVGTRVTAVSDGTGAEGAEYEILLDGKKPETFKDMWAITRPSNNPKNWMPAINNIGFEKPLVEEDWTLTALPDSATNALPVHFKLEGSVTGPAGEGYSTNRFVSATGMAIIEPIDWRLPWALGYVKIPLPENFQVKWKSYPLFARTYKPQPAGTITTLVQGCDTAEHVLTLKVKGKGASGIAAFKIHTPPLKTN